MELNDYDAELELDEEDRRHSSVAVKTGALKALLAIVICFVVTLLLFVGLIVYGTKTGRVSLDNVIVDPNAEPLVYTESEMQSMVAQAREEALAEKESEVKEATRQGYVLGESDILDYIRETLLNTNSTLRTFKMVYPDYLVIVSKGAYHFLPIDYSLAQSELKQEKIKVADSGEFTYVDDDGNVISHKGIDVSEYQGKIDWEKVAEDGVEFAIMRAYYRGYGTGRLVEDGKIDDNLQGAIDAGVKVGVYVFSQAINEEEAVEEAQSAIDKLSEYTTGGVPIVMDIERVSGANTRMEELSVEERTDVVIAFCETVKAAGYIPVVYFNTEMGGLYVDLPRLEEYRKWYAFYGDWLYFPYKYDMWQYTDSGKVNGIGGSVDMNMALDMFW